MPQLEAWQTLEHACDAYFDETESGLGPQASRCRSASTGRIA